MFTCNIAVYRLVHFAGFIKSECARHTFLDCKNISSRTLKITMFFLPSKVFRIYKTGPSKKTDPDLA